MGDFTPKLLIGMDGPIQEATSKFILNEKACAEISKIEGNVSVVTIAGLYRTGKSFVMNQLAGSNNGFDIGATVEPCTEGIWMWVVDASKIDPSLYPKDTTVILLDTEGLGSFQKNTTHDVKIFSLAVLLSSFFVYNSLGTIDDNAMDKLSLVVELTKYIRTQAGDHPSDAGQLSMYFPKFMWLVRDFSLELIYQGKEISPDEYLEKALLPLKAESDDDFEGKNQIRQAITQAFRDRSCFTLKRPVNDEELLQTLSTATMDQFRPEFLDQMKVLKEYIYHHLQPKRLYGHNINGNMLIELAKSYVEAINKGGVPVISSAWESVVQIEGTKALETAIQFYEKNIEEALKKEGVMETEQLQKLHKKIKTESIALFRKKAVGEDLRAFEDELESTVSKHFESTEFENHKKSTELCKRILGEIFRDLSLMVNEGQIQNIDSLESRWQGYTQKYEKEAKGPAKYYEFFKASDQLFGQSRKVTLMEIAAVEEKANQKLQEEKEKAKKEYQRLEKLYTTVDEEWKKSADENKNLRENNKKMTLEMATMEKNLKKFEELQEENSNLKKKIEELEKSKTKNEDILAVQDNTPNEKEMEKSKKKKNCTIL